MGRRAKERVVPDAGSILPRLAEIARSEDLSGI
jgi:hypothetical protein